MPDSLNLKLSPSELDYVFKLLARQPWGEVNPLMLSIQQQVKEQQSVAPKGDYHGPG